MYIKAVQDDPEVIQGDDSEVIHLPTGRIEAEIPTLNRCTQFLVHSLISLDQGLRGSETKTPVMGIDRIGNVSVCLPQRAVLYFILRLISRH